MTNDLYRAMASEIVRLVPSDLVAFARPLTSEDGFHIAAAYPDSASALDFQVSGPSAFCTQVSANQSSRVLVVGAEEAISPEEEALRPWGIREIALVPLCYHGKPQGVALVGSRHPGVLGGAFVRSLEQLSGLLAASLATAGAGIPTLESGFGAHASTRRLLQEEDQESLCRGLLEEVQRHTPCRRMVLTLLDAEMKSYQWFFAGLRDEEMEAFHRQGLTEEKRREIFEKEQVDEFKVRCGTRIYVPLSGSRSRPLGYLVLDPAREEERLDPEHISFVHTAAALTASALERNWVFVELKRERNRLQKIQEQLVHSERLSAVGQLVSGVAHELNNPLAGVVGFSELVQKNNRDEKCAKNLERVVQEARRCRHIVGNLLNFVRRTKAERRAIDVNEIVENVLDLRSYALKLDDVTVVTELEEDLPHSTGSFHQIQQVLLNVINNAHQAMQESDGDKRLEVSTFHEGERVVIRIEDTGPGIAPARLERVFEPFFTTKDQGKGTGLGLSLSQGIIKEHGGNIRVESTVDRGTTFTIELPVREGSELPVKTASPVITATREQTPQNILVVDDEQIIVDLLNEVLISAGHTVQTARDGKQALQKILSGGYDAVISDLKMPGMDGEGLYEAVCQKKPEMKGRFVFSTGDLASSSTQDFFRKTGCPYIMKPFDLQAVRDVLEQLLSKS